MSDTFHPAPFKPAVPLSDLAKLDIRLGTIRSVTEIADSRHLVELEVDFGDCQRTILAGLKSERDDPSAIAGQQSLFVVNLEPKTMFGRTSQGMLLDIGYEDGLSPALALPEHPLPNGSRAG